MKRFLIALVGSLLAFSGPAIAAEMNTSAKCPVGQDCSIRLDNDLQLENRVSGDVDLSFHDYADTADDDMQHAVITLNCTTTTTGAEDCDISMAVVEAGAAADVRLLIDADSGVDIGSATTADFTVTTTGSALSLETAANTLTLTAATTGTFTILGADAAGASDLLIDTSTTGAITIGSGDVTSVTILTDGLNGSVVLDGSVLAQIPVTSLSSGALTVNAINLATAGGADYDIPDGACHDAADVGNWVTVVIEDDSVVVSVTSDDASDVFFLPGLDIAAGRELDSISTAAYEGAHVTLVCMAAHQWYATSSTTEADGTTFWADGGAAD